MIPYFPQPVWRVGPFEMHAFGAAVALALLCGYGLVLRRARRYGIDPTHAGTYFVVILLAGLALGWIVGRGSNSISGTGFAAGGGAALVVCAWVRRSWNLLDLIGGAVPLMNVFARIGCFLAHDHIGRPTASWLGVRFPHGTRFDLGLLYALSAAGVALVVEWISRRRDTGSGVTFGVMVALMAITRLIVLRFGDTISLTDEVFAGLMFVGGCQIVVSRWMATTKP
ncbi:MAG TPA: prolipoprotein diacylglyceryl transferase family protein [Bryobacteraceae bacterium]|jgi:prolipoprotein diacylglyceryltransferase